MQLAHSGRSHAPDFEPLTFQSHSSVARLPLPQRHRLWERVPQTMALPPPGIGTISQAMLPHIPISSGDHSGRMILRPAGVLKRADAKGAEPIALILTAQNLDQAIAVKCKVRKIGIKN